MEICAECLGVKERGDTSGSCEHRDSKWAMKTETREKEGDGQGAEREELEKALDCDGAASDTGKMTGCRILEAKRRPDELLKDSQS